MKGKSTLGLTTAGIPGCSFSRCMVLFGGTSRRCAPSGTRRGIGCDERSGWLALFTLGFWTLLLRARGSGKRLPRCVGVYPRLLLGEFQLSLGVFARAVRTWRVRLGRGPRHAPVYGCFCMNFLCSRCSHLNLVHSYCVPVSGSHCSARLGVAYVYENWILPKMTFFVGAILGLTVDTCSASVLWLWTNFTHFLRCGRLES